MPDETPALTELEEVLANDSNGSEFKRICDELIDQETGIKRVMDSGLAPADYQQAVGLNDAVKTAQTVVQSFWNARHGQ